MKFKDNKLNIITIEHVNILKNNNVSISYMIKKMIRDFKQVQREIELNKLLDDE